MVARLVRQVLKPYEGTWICCLVVIGEVMVSELGFASLVAGSLLAEVMVTWGGREKPHGCVLLDA